MHIDTNRIRTLQKTLQNVTQVLKLFIGISLNVVYSYNLTIFVHELCRICETKVITRSAQVAILKLTHCDPYLSAAR